MPAEIRPARPEDVPAIVEVQGTWPGAPSVEQRVERIRDAIVAPKHPALLVVAEDAGEIVAFARCGVFGVEGDEAVPQGWYLLGLSVREDCRRQGLATALVQHRLDWLWERTDDVYYFTDASNDASIALHARFGFVEVRRGIHVPQIVFQPEGVLLVARRPA